MRRSRIRAPTWSSIAAVDRPLFGFAIVSPLCLVAGAGSRQPARPAFSVNANKARKFPTRPRRIKIKINRSAICQTEIFPGWMHSTVMR
jgi:hypothetical protein